ncbi:MAG: hypothetical protein JSV91_08530 [Phycisphaerales bacterium]|nr:MAG: hypothetical protein JSV91_08530 [Phycisphaerales bacterium]
MVKRLVIIVLMLGLAAPAMADDLIPPPWDRYTPNTVFAHWTFDSPANDEGQYVAEDFWQLSVFDDPYIDSYYNDAYWLDEFEGRDGVINPWGGDYLQMHLDNYDCYSPVKFIYLQITWWTDGYEGDRPLPDVWDAYSPHGPVDWSVAEITDEFELGDGWWYSRWYIEMWPNPEWEWINFYPAWSEDMYIDQIVVDTLCIPAPGALALLGLAGLIRRRRR